MSCPRCVAYRHVDRRLCAINRKACRATACEAPDAACGKACSRVLRDCELTATREARRCDDAPRVCLGPDAYRHDLCERGFYECAVSCGRS